MGRRDRDPGDPGPAGGSQNLPSTIVDHYPTGSAPVDIVVRRGRIARRRRRRAHQALVAAGCAALLAVGGGVVVVSTSGDRDVVAQDPNAAQDVDPSGGVLWVGLGQVAIAVPDSWTVDDTTCDDPADKSVYFPTGQRCSDGAVEVSSVAITSSEPGEVLETPRDRGDIVDGHPVFEGPQRCTTHSDFFEPGAPITNTRRQCTLTFGVPDLDGWFRVRLVGDDAESLINDIRDSLRVLPATEVAVPPLDGAGLDDTVARLRAVGLHPVVDSACGPTAACSIPTVEGVGTVVDVGSDVVVTTAVADPTTDETAGRRRAPRAPSRGSPSLGPTQTQVRSPPLWLQPCRTCCPGPTCRTPPMNRSVAVQAARSGCSSTARPTSSTPPSPASGTPPGRPLRGARPWGEDRSSTPSQTWWWSVVAVGDGSVTLVRAVTTDSGNWNIVALAQDIQVGAVFPDRSLRALTVTDAEPRHATVIRLGNVERPQVTWRRVSWTGAPLAQGKRAVSKALSCRDRAR